jgi:hypothetical protein
LSFTLNTLISFFLITRSTLTTSTFFPFAFNPCYLLCLGFPSSYILFNFLYFLIMATNLS